MKSFIGRLLPAFLLVLALFGVIAIFGTIHATADGADIALFQECDNGVCCLFGECVNLFEAEEPNGVSGSGDPVKLFEESVDEAYCDALQRAFSDCVKPANLDSRPVMRVYCPPWCGLCHDMQILVGEGDARLRVKFIKGDEKSFPACVQESGAKSGYPVEWWNSPSGKGAMHNGIKTLDELVAWAQLEPGETLSPKRSKPVKHHVSTLVRGSN